MPGLVFTVLIAPFSSSSFVEIVCCQQGVALADFHAENRHCYPRFSNVQLVSVDFFFLKWLISFSINVCAAQTHALITCLVWCSNATNAEESHLYDGWWGTELDCGRERETTEYSTKSTNSEAYSPVCMPVSWHAEGPFGQRNCCRSYTVANYWTGADTLSHVLNFLSHCHGTCPQTVELTGSFQGLPSHEVTFRKICTVVCQKKQEQSSLVLKGSSPWGPTFPHWDWFCLSWLWAWVGPCTSLHCVAQVCPMLCQGHISCFINLHDQQSKDSHSEGQLLKQRYSRLSLNR